MSLINIYALLSEFQSFIAVSDYADISRKVPFGYHFEDHKWAYLYNSSTGNKIGILVFNNNFHNININNADVAGKFSYINNNYVVFIDKAYSSEYPAGSLYFIFNSITLLSTTILPNSNVLNASFVAGTEEYYLKSYDITLQRIGLTTLNIKIYPKQSIPRIINNSTEIYVIADGSKFNTFKDITHIDQKVVKIPQGYHYRDVRWVQLQHPTTYEIIGKILLINNYHNIDSLKRGGYCNNTITVFIDKVFPVGSIGYVINFYNPANNTGFIPGSTIFPTALVLTGAYYGRYVTVKIITGTSLLRNIYFTITPPL